MNPFVAFEKIWEDDDLYEFHVRFSDGESTFSHPMYFGVSDARGAANELQTFSSQVHGGNYDLSIGKFGPEYASGALNIRFHFHTSGNGKLFLTVSGEYAWDDFADLKVASSSRMHLRTEPALLDKFITEFGMLAEGSIDKAVLVCV